MEEGTFLWNSTGIGNNTESILLKLVVVEEAEGLVLDDALIELKASLLYHLL